MSQERTHIWDGSCGWVPSGGAQGPIEHSVLLRQHTPLSDRWVDLRTFPMYGTVMPCSCSEKSRPLPGDLPAGSNQRPRQWVVLMYKETSLGRWSDYSRVFCRVCGGYWKSKASYVDTLPMDTTWPEKFPESAEAWVD